MIRKHKELVKCKRNHLYIHSHTQIRTHKNQNQSPIANPAYRWQEENRNYLRYIIEMKLKQNPTNLQTIF